MFLRDLFFAGHNGAKGHLALTRIFREREKIKRVKGSTAAAHTHTAIGIAVAISRLRLFVRLKNVLKKNLN